MKTLAALSILVLFVLTTGFANPEPAEDVIKTSLYCDHFDQCESKPALAKEIMLTRGVKSVVVDGRTQTITIKYRPEQVTPDKIRTVVSNAGYDADSVKANADAYEKPDGCCKKK